MGSMNNGGFGGGDMPSFGSFGKDSGKSDSFKDFGKNNKLSVQQTGNFKFSKNDSAPDMPNGFDPNNMPDDFDPSQFGGDMPDNPPDISSESTESKEVSTDSDSEEKTGGSFERPEKSMEKPQMNDFPMNGSSQKDNTTEYILLGISALFLLIGFVFALKFKR